MSEPKVVHEYEAVGTKIRVTEEDGKHLRWMLHNGDWCCDPTEDADELARLAARVQELEEKHEDSEYRNVHLEKVVDDQQAKIARLLEALQMIANNCNHPDEWLNIAREAVGGWDKAPKEEAMKPSTFDLANDTLKGGPAEKYRTAVDVIDLPICRLDRAVVSLWRPTLLERLSILVFGRVWVHVNSDNHPPIFIAGRRNYLCEEKP